MSLVTLLSDFGTRDTYAGVVEGAILRVAPAARSAASTHAVRRDSRSSIPGSLTRMISSSTGDGTISNSRRPAPNSTGI